MSATSPAAEKPDRQALLLRARRRIEEKRLFQKVLLGPSDSKNDGDDDSFEAVPRTLPSPSSYDLNSIPLPASRYRRVSLNATAGSVPFISRARSISYGFDDTPAAIQQAVASATSASKSAEGGAKRNTPTISIPPTIGSNVSLNITDENLPIQPVPTRVPPKIDIGNDNLISPSSRTEFFEPLSARRAISASRDSLGNPISKKVEKLLERGVSMSPIKAVDIEYTGLSVTPETPRVETEQEVKRKGILMKRGKKLPMPDDSPIKEEEIHEITELQELYSSNSSLTVRIKCTSNATTGSQNYAPNRTFIYPAPFSQTIKITYTLMSPLDGFYIPDTPIIAPWNYDRLLRRLHKTEPDGPWFNGNYTLSLQPDPINHIHYRPLSVDNQDWSEILDHEAALVRLPAQIMKNEDSLPPTSLIVDLSGLDIRAHPLMLEEHVLARTLEDLVTTMQSRKRTHLIPFLFEKVISLQNAYIELKKQFDVLKTAKIDSSMDHLGLTTTSAFAPTPKMRMKLNAEQKLKQRILDSRDGMVRLLKEILAARQLRDTEAQTSRLLEYRIIKTWDRIKGLRISQGFSSTGIKLYIRTSLVERVNYREEAEKEVMYKKELWELENIEKNLSLSQDYLAAQKDNTGDTDPLLKMHSASKFIGRNVDHLDSFQDKKVYDNAVRRLKACYPSQPELELRIDSSNPITNHMDCPHPEQTRRHSTEASRFFLMLYYNGNLITKTNPKELNSKFGLTFTSLTNLSRLEGLSAKSNRACFVLSVTDIPRNFKVHVYEAGILGDTFISEVYVPLPPFGDLAASLDRHAGSVDFTGTHSPIEGKLNISLSWGDNPRAAISSPSPLPTDPLSFHGPAGLLNLPSMIEWILRTNFDPNDPRNADLMKIRELIDSVAGHDTLSLSSWNSQGFFRVGLPAWLHRMTLGVGPENLEDYQARFKTLMGRFKRELVYSGPVPLALEEFTALPPANPYSLRDSTESKVLKNWDARYSLKDGSEPKFVDLGFLKRIRDLQMIRKNGLKMPRHVDDFVGESRFQFQPDDQIDFMFLFRPFRPLNPHRTNRQNVITKDADRCKLVIQLVAGINLPMRKNTRGSKLKPFVELSFQKRKTRSITSEGPNPQWNQTLAIEIEAPDGDFRPEALMETDIATDCIIINVFDEIVIDLLQDEREREREMYIRQEKVWLGSIQIPFTSVWERSRIDGKFPVNIPPSLLGYGNDLQNDEAIRIDTQDQSMLHIFVTLDPPLAQPPALKLKFQTEEHDDLIKTALKFQEQATAIGKPTLLLTNDMSGKSTLITRFIRPQNPPPSLKNAHQLARFVAAIPFLPNRTVFAVTCNLWSTSDQVLNVGAGDSIDHALLLCNLLLALDYEARVIIGSSLIDGKCAFVMYRNKDDEGSRRNSANGPPQPGVLSRFMGSFANYGTNIGRLDASEVNDRFRVCDPITGNIYHVQDKRCPLMEVTSIFDDKNVWLNLQSEKKLDKTLLDVTDTAMWRPFNSSQSVHSGLVSVQPAILEYKQPSIKWIADLEQAIERLVVSKFEDWRKGSVTRWNRLCSRSFKTLIARFEDDLIAGIDLSISIQDSNELNSISRVYKLSGHPVSMPYTDGLAICNAIQSRGVHENVQNGVEFALAVHCVGYAGSTTSTGTAISNNKPRQARLIYGFDGKTSRDYLLDVSKTSKRGLDVLHDPLLNKGSAFSLAERERLGLRGLLPPRVQTMDQQVERNAMYFEAAKTMKNDPEAQKDLSDLQLYRDLGSLADRNETLFYRLLMDNFANLAPIIYTPTVGQACQKSHTIYRQARGMYFSKEDRGQISSMMYNWPNDDVKVIVVTDGSRVLGLGDLGCNGMPIPVGKLNLYCAAGGINPKSVLPVVLDVGTNNTELRTHPLYLGIPEPRLEGQEYYDFVDEWIHAVYSRWPRVLVQFEDFKNPHAQELLTKYRNRFLCFNDDIQSTGAIALAGVLSSLRARGLSFKDLGKERIVCAGAGSAGIGVCDTIIEAMMRLGVVATKQEGYERFHLVDQFGLLGKDRPAEKVTSLQEPYLRNDTESGLTLLQVIQKVKPTILLGLSGAGGLFSEEIIKEMSAHVQQPVIFPLSNPTKNSECSAQQAFEWSDGRALFASGSPFEDVALKGKIHPTSQCNNYYIFPGVGLGILNCQPATVPNEFFIEAAKIVADKTEYANTGRLFPEVNKIRDISIDIAVRVCEVAQQMAITSITPPRGKSWREVIKTRMWDPKLYNTIVNSNPRV